MAAANRQIDVGFRGVNRQIDVGFLGRGMRGPKIRGARTTPLPTLTAMGMYMVMVRRVRERAALGVAPAEGLLG